MKMLDAPRVLAGTLAACAGLACAQSSVTVFGVVDVNLRVLKNGEQRQTQVATDGLSASRLGFRGVEEISENLKAGFHLESAVVPDTGNINGSGKFWHRRSTVSLISSNYGELRLGRDTVPTWLAYVDGDVYSTTGIGDASKTYRVLGGADTRLRSDNLVAYFLPANRWAVYGAIASAPREGQDGRRYLGARLGYRTGPVDASVAASETSVATGKFKLAIASGSYDFGVAKVYGVLQKTELLDASNIHAALGLSAPVPALGITVRASVAKADGRGLLETQDATQYVLGGIYDLSKRTALYTTVSVIDNQGTADYTVADIPGSPLLAGQRSQGVEAGLRHSF